MFFKNKIILTIISKLDSKALPIIVCVFVLGLSLFFFLMIRVFNCSVIKEYMEDMVDETNIFSLSDLLGLLFFTRWFCGCFQTVHLFWTRGVKPKQMPVHTRHGLAHWCRHFIMSGDNISFCTTTWGQRRKWERPKSKQNTPKIPLQDGL